MSLFVTDTMPPTIHHVRAYFAPVNRPGETASIFDPASLGRFDLDAPPAPWIDLGFISNFKRTSETKIAALEAGAPAAAQSQARTQIGAAVSLRFEGWGKLQMALAAGTQQLNLLAPASGATAAGSGGAAVAATALAIGATATSLPLSSPMNSPNGAFAAGSLIAVDVDNTGQTGFVGAAVSGAYLRTAVPDVDYVRRITLNVARVASNSNGVLTLSEPLLAGVPATGMKVSPVVGFCDREGSSFFAEWSALFVGEGQQGERVLWHYPRLQAMQGIAETAAQASGGFESLGLVGSFRALPVKDAVDGETVVCFRSYLPG